SRPCVPAVTSGLNTELVLAVAASGNSAIRAKGRVRVI
ncbi:MAG: hypothetical protein ACI9GB_003934, partial [Halioglobus sp.]